MDKNNNKKSKMYFTKKTEESLVKFIKENDLETKNKIYTNELYHELDEMIRININVHKYYQTGLELESLVQETHLHLIEKFREFKWNEINGFDKFDPNKGGAFSYCNRMIKNFLIQLQEKNQRKIRKLGFESIDDDNNFYIQTYFEEQKDFDSKEVIDIFINTIKQKRLEIFTKEDEIIIADTIITILEDERNNFKNKKSFIHVYKNIRRDKGYKINKVLNIMKLIYLDVKEKYILENVSK